MNDVTRILSAIEAGDPQAAEQLLPLIYDELRRLAAQRLAREAPGQTLQATALVHEAYLRLMRPDGAERWEGRGHFFAAAAEAMRRILVENARRRQSDKHGGGRRRHRVEDVRPAAREPDANVLDIDEALSKFAEIDPLKAELVKLRFFAGCTNQEAARLLGISTATGERYWAYARAWLHQEITGGAGCSPRKPSQPRNGGDP
jgi:RNA polymerase sigma factor (TIGR02999 family)